MRSEELVSTLTPPAEPAHRTEAAPSPRRVANAARLSLTSLPALALVRRPRGVRTLAILLATILVLTPVALVFVPWQQNVAGSGRVVAYDPRDRVQSIESPINGRIQKWYVVEGSRVRKGERIVDLVDNDPDYVDRLKLQRETVISKLTTYESLVDLYAAQAKLTEAERDQGLDVARLKLESLVEKVRAAEQVLAAERADLDLKKFKRDQYEPLAAEKISSRFTFAEADNDYKQAVAKVRKAEADLKAVGNDRDSQAAELDKIRAGYQVKFGEIDAYRRKARTDVETTRKELSEIDVKLAQQGTQHVDAPFDGVVFRIRANQQSVGQVKSGDVLLDVVPDTESRVVELYLNGNDAPLVTDSPVRDRSGRIVRNRSQVRLQFEGWPAVQFVGWPSVAVGTFGGEVVLVDPTDDGQGKFRILVAPDGIQDWPDGRWLRQGVRAKGWVLLKTVPLGWEIWRRLNGFPPTVQDDAPKEQVKIKRPK